MAQSKRFQLNYTDWDKILTGAIIASAGALFTYLLEILPQVDFGDLSPMVVAIASILINTIKKWIEGKKS